MHKLTNFGEIIFSLVLIGLLTIFLLPTKLLMPMSSSVMMILVLIIVFLGFSIFIWKEKAHDEREHLHILNAGRISYFIGCLILICGIIIQSLSHNIDPWLIYTLIVMVLAKILSRFYSQNKQ